LPPCATPSSASWLEEHQFSAIACRCPCWKTWRAARWFRSGCAPPAILSRSIDFESGSAAEPWSAAQRFARISPRSLALQTETLAPDRSRDRAPSRNPTRSRCRQRRCVSHKNWRVQGCGGRSIASIDLRRRRQISGRPPVFAVAAEIRRRRRAWAVPPRSPAAPAAGRSRWCRGLRGS
jgi:hypothetical protein